MKSYLELFVVFSILSSYSVAHATLLVTDDFSDGDRTNNPAWFISQGSFAVSFGEANNNNTSVNQFFTTAFAETDLSSNQDGFRLTLSYRPEGENLASVRVGIFDGPAPAADNWDQWTAGQPTRDWRGYQATIGVNGSATTEIRRNDNAVDDHAFFAGTVIGAAGTTINVAGSSNFRWIRFEMYRSNGDMVLEVFEGATVDTLVSLGQVTDTSDDGAPFFNGFNNLAFYQTTSNGNGHIRYDNITLEAVVIPEPSSIGLIGLGLTALLTMIRRGRGC